MYTLSPTEVQLLVDGLDMLYRSNKRMQTSKPKFLTIFHEIENDINSLKLKILSPPTKQK